MIKNNNNLDSLSKNLLNDVRSVLEGKKKACKCDNNCACGKEEKDEAEEKGEVKEAKKMKGEDPCWKDYKMVGTKKGKGGKEVPNCVPEETEIKEGEEKGGGYNATAVNKAISSSRQKIGGREAKKIHALLKGSTGYAAKKNAEDTKKTFPNVKHLTKDGHPDWKKHGMGEEAELEEGEEKGGGYNAPTAKGAMTYKKVLGQHTVHKGGVFHRSFPSEGDAKNYIQKKQGEEPKKKTYSYNEEAELDEAKAESPIKGTRLISKHEGKDGHHVEVRHNPDWNEFQVHHYKDGKHMGEGPVSYHDTKADAKETAEYEVKNYRPKGGSLQKEEVDKKQLGRKVNLTSYTRKVSTHQGEDGHHAEVRHDSVTGEYQVHHFVNGKHMGADAMQHHGAGAQGKKDATDEANHITKTFSKHFVNHFSPKNTKKVSTHKGENDHHVEVHHDLDKNEYQVHHYNNGEHVGGGPVSFHGTKADATKSAEHQAKNFHVKNGNIQVKEEVELDEKLIGKQHKIDKNKNGKLDKQDFKMLRKEETIEEKLDASMGAGKYVTDFVKSKDPRFEGKTKKERIKMALGAYYGAKNEAVEKIEEVAHGSKRDYAKHHIEVDGKYITTTTWARNAKEAEKRFLQAHPEHKGSRITISKD